MFRIRLCCVANAVFRIMFPHCLVCGNDERLLDMCVSELYCVMGSVQMKSWNLNKVQYNSNGQWIWSTAPRDPINFIDNRNALPWLSHRAICVVNKFISASRLLKSFIFTNRKSGSGKLICGQKLPNCLKLICSNSIQFWLINKFRIGLCGFPSWTCSICRNNSCQGHTIYTHKHVTIPKCWVYACHVSCNNIL